MIVMTVVGARPQFIKAAVVSRAFKSFRSDVKEIIVHTGQHYDANMSDIFFEELDIPRPDVNLGVGGGTHGQNTGRMLEQLEAVMLDIKPSWVLVYGDTDSTLAGALAAAKLHIPVAHVEAGLRSFNRKMPEEINRIMTDHLAETLFVPTEIGRNNLLNEGVKTESIKVVGDVMYDAALYYRERAKKPLWFDATGFGEEKFVLCTIHRAENTDDLSRMLSIFEGLFQSGKPIVLPLHPRTKHKLAAANLEVPSNVLIVEPVGYLEMVWLEMHCESVATDSGGVQKEAYFHGKPCITLRDETEWLELIESGWNQLCGTNSSFISSALRSQKDRNLQTDLYGFGDAAEKIVSELLK